MNLATETYILDVVGVLGTRPGYPEEYVLRKFQEQLFFRRPMMGYFLCTVTKREIIFQFGMSQVATERCYLKYGGRKS